MRRTGLSGAASEAGGQYRASVAAYFAVHLLRGLPIQELDLPLEVAVPIALQLEADDAVDDIVLTLSGGGRAYVQSKRTLTLRTSPGSPFAEAVEQWYRLVSAVTVDASRERVAIATSRLGAPLTRLRDALARGRWSVAAARSGPEEASHARLRQLLSRLPPQTVENVLRAGVLIALDVKDDGGVTAQLAQQMLENGVVPPGSGARAWCVLTDECRRRSAVRRGFDLGDLVEVLRSAGVPLTVDRSGAASARRAARDEAVTAYRAQLIRRGEELDLAGLGAQLPTVPLVGADAETRVQEASSDKLSDRRLTWSIRRHSRLLLTGPPGGGKSTTLRASAADFARRADWPLPVFAKLTDLARQLPGTSFHDALFAASTAPLDLEPASIELVREAFDDAIRDGRAALFLDALDETRIDRHETVRRIRQFLQTAHPDLELVLATREVAYADAAVLNLREIGVVAPRYPERTAHKILEIAAEHRGVEEVDRPEWVRERQHWVQRALDRDRTLSRTPLIPVVLAVLASKSEVANLPAKRAEILRLVLEDIVKTWEAGERLHDQVTLGVLEGQRAVTALLLSLPVVGAALSSVSQVARAEVEGIVTNVLRVEFGLARADARAAASEALSFWDEAGVFVVASDGMVSPRLRLFAEIAAAVRLAALEGEELGKAVASAAVDPNQHEMLQLSAGLSPAVAQALWAETIRQGADNRLAMTLANAIAEGADVSADTVAGLARRLASTVDDSENWPAAVALARLPVPVGVRAEVLDAAERALNGGALTTFRALAVLRWRETGPEADEALRAVLRAERVKLGGWLVDDGYAEALVGAADRLRSRGDADLALIAAALGKASMGVDEKLAAILREEGRGADVTEYYGRFTSRLRASRFFEVEREADKILLEQIATVGTQTELTHRQQRRLDELCDFVTTLGLPEASGADVVRAVTNDLEEVLSLLHHVAPLTGIDVDVVASEAQLVRELLETDDGPSAFSMLFDDGTDQGLGDWTRVDNDAHLRNVLRAHIAGRRWLAVPAAIALSAAPDRDVATQELDRVFDDYAPWNRRLAGKVVMHLDANHVDRAKAWLTSADPVRRMVAAEVIATDAAVDSGLRPLLDEALADPDEGVRADAYSALDVSTVDDALRRVAWAEVEGDPTGWFCIWCGNTNEPDSSGCASCSTSGPDAAKAAREFLSAVGEDVPDVKDHVHRHVKIVTLDELP